MISRIFDVIARRIDGPLMAALALTLALGLTVVYSASGGSSAERLVGQARNLALALFMLWLFAQVHPQVLMRLALPLYVGGLALLIGVAFFGEVRNGARRWLYLGVTTVQPSEVMKIAVPLVLAWYFHRREEGLRMRDFAIAAVILVIPVGLIVRQPDLGTALLIFASGFFVIFLAGLSWKIIGSRFQLRSRVILSRKASALSRLPKAPSCSHNPATSLVMTGVSTITGTGAGAGSGCAAMGSVLSNTRSTSTMPLPADAMPIFAAAAYERSITRLEWKGPRSLMRTTTHLPFFRFVTFA